jgi:hypothetical protein
MPPQPAPGRLHLVLQRTSEDVNEPDYASDAPLVQFIAFEPHQRLFGWVRLRADRLTDLLNTHDEILLTDLEIEGLEDGARQSVDEVLVRCSDVIAVQAGAPRGEEARRLPTRTHPVAMQAGSYLIGGYLHAPPGQDPIASVADRPPMIPLTDAWIESWSGSRRTTQSSGTIIVNRAKAEWIQVVTEEELFSGLLRPSPIPGRKAS